MNEKKRSGRLFVFEVTRSCRTTRRQRSTPSNLESMHQENLARSTLSVVGNIDFASISRLMIVIVENREKKEGLFLVMAIRTMGQFIGREQAYSSINLFQNFQEIYERQGLGGFFVGLIPRWLLEISMIVISNVLIHLLKSQLPTQKEMIPLYEYMASVD